ncbi:hypothetical protein A9P82_08990 [Arachidicoccus ginsenosidimutans]|uniref:SatD family protein n=1 Tax=Arachidicoccus sp. BS20 TaxID=1850526 RepID=UPI0007F0F31F|nr:SatD family protein [Arachidicoccus sp. BS20]ANI89419.1 hypothetical protein A9P82_08990 [Arachidicoccus sp. BS20]
MIAVLTGDIIHSEKQQKSSWLKALKKVLSSFGKSPKDWEIYRGDEFQLQLPDAKEALLAALRIKSYIKSVENIDARIAIGLGDKTINAAKVTESNGSAFVNSGRLLDDLKKEKTSLALASGNDDFDKEMNLMLRLALVSIDSWSAVSAEIVYLFLSNPKLQQTEVAQQLEIRQSAVSQRLRRANYDLLVALIDFYQQKIQSL